MVTIFSLFIFDKKMIALILLLSSLSLSIWKIYQLFLEDRKIKIEWFAYQQAIQNEKIGKAFYESRLPFKTWLEEALETELSLHIVSIQKQMGLEETLYAPLSLQLPSEEILSVLMHVEYPFLKHSPYAKIMRFTYEKKTPLPFFEIQFLEKKKISDSYP